MPVVAITHTEAELPRFYLAEDLARLRAAAEVRVLGSNRPADIAGRLADVDIVSGSWGMPRWDAALLAAAPRLKAVCYAAGSVKGFVSPELWARGVAVTSAWRANAIPVAEVSEALIVLASKDWFRCQDRLRAEGRSAWDGLHHSPHWGAFRTTVGLVGFGAIGRLVAERLRRHDFELLVYDPYATAEQIAACGAAKVADLVELARRSRIVSLHAPDIDACAGMCGAAFFQALPDGAHFVNTARGRLVDEAALIAELTRGRISAYLDVTHPEPPAPDSPLWRLPNCWLTPHRAGSSAGEIRRMGRYAIEDALRILAGQEPEHRVTEAMLATMA